MSNMTPFEIRLELLKMAKEMLESDYYGQRECLNNEWQLKCGQAADNNQAIPEHPQYPPYPTESQIIQKATELNKFVSNGS